MTLMTTFTVMLIAFVMALASQMVLCLAGCAVILLVCSARAEFRRVHGPRPS